MERVHFDSKIIFFLTNVLLCFENSFLNIKHVPFASKIICSLTDVFSLL
jgi:hypothetical protein